MTRIRMAFLDQGGGGGIDTDKAKAWDVGRLIYESDDPVASKDNLAACRSRGVGVGLMRDPDWPRDTVTATQVAEKMHEDLTDHGFGSNTSPDSCWAIFDNERQSADEIVTMLRAWRALRPTRKTVWTLMCFQGGWFTEELVALVNNDPNLYVSPQAYINDTEPGTDPGYDPMYPVAAEAMIQDLVDAGIHRAKILPFLDATRHEVPYGWQGILFGFQDRPATPPMPL